MVKHKLISKVEKSSENCSIKFPRAFAKACEFLGKSASLYIYLLFGIQCIVVLGIVKRKKKFEARVIF